MVPEYSTLRHDSVAIVWLLRAREKITREFGKTSIENPPSYQSTNVGFKSFNIKMTAPDVECAQKTSLPHSCMMFRYADSPEGREAGAS